jgi:hypothetical protein
LINLYIQSGFIARFFFSHLKIGLNNVFSILQIARAKSPPKGLVFQISDQHNKISDLMHPYFQSAHEEHQMGLAHTIIQFV